MFAIYRQVILLGVDCEDFFNNLVTQIAEYQSDSQPFIICGDFNARCADISHHIEGVNCCIVNGRNSTQNDFTCRNVSVVDYCIIPYERLNNIQEFRVQRSTELFQAAGCIGRLDPTRAIPDHNLLYVMGVVIVRIYRECGNEGIDVANQDTVEDGNSLSSLSKPAVTKFKLNDIPHDFMSDPDIVSMIDEHIHRITAMQDVETALDDAYGNFCDTLKECMIRHYLIIR